MKKMLIVFGLLVLIGAGCAKSPVPADSDTEVSNEMTVPTMDEDGNVVDMIVTQDPNKEYEDGIEIQEIKLAQTILTVKMDAGNMYFKPNVINALGGDEVEITFTNSGFHTIVIDEIGLKAKIEDGGKVTFKAPMKPGSYAFYCDVGNHRAQGMEGTLIVR